MWGAAAASMAVLRNKYGDLYREGLNQVFSPNNHPKTSSRVQDNIDSHVYCILAITLRSIMARYL